MVYQFLIWLGSITAMDEYKIYRQPIVLELYLKIL